MSGSMRMLTGSAKMGNNIEVPQKIKIELLNDLAIPLLGSYPKKRKTDYQRHACPTIFIAEVLTIAKIGKQPEYPSMYE